MTCSTTFMLAANTCTNHTCLRVYSDKMLNELYLCYVKAKVVSFVAAEGRRELPKMTKMSIGHEGHDRARNVVKS